MPRRKAEGSIKIKQINLKSELVLKVKQSCGIIHNKCDKQLAPVKNKVENKEKYNLKEQVE